MGSRTATGRTRQLGVAAWPIVAGLCALMLGSTPATAAAAGRLEVRVRDAAASRRQFYADVEIRSQPPPGRMREVVRTPAPAVFENLLPGRYAVQVDAYDMHVGRDTVTVRAGHATRVTISLRSRVSHPGRLSVVVVDSARGEPMAGAWVELAGQQVPGESPEGVRTDARGRARFDNLVPQDFYVITRGKGCLPGGDALRVLPDREVRGVIRLRPAPPAPPPAPPAPQAPPAPRPTPHPAVVLDYFPEPGAELTVKLVAAADERPLIGLPVRLTTSAGAFFAARTDTAGEVKVKLVGERRLGMTRVCAGDTLGFAPAEFRIELEGGEGPYIVLPLRRRAPAHRAPKR